MVSGSWPGEIFVFFGKEDGSYDEPQMLRNKDGEVINIGGGIDEREDAIYITGSAEFERTDEGTYVNYHGRKIKNTLEKPIYTTGSASAVAVADWDGDKDYDLIVGDIDGRLHCIINEGTPDAYAFNKEMALQVGGEPLVVEGTAGPCVADWDHDGDPDLLVGVGDGSVVMFENIGTTENAALTYARLLLPSRDVKYDDAPEGVHRGDRSKVCTVDWNADGRLDLLVGDYATQKVVHPEFSEEAKSTHAKIREKLESLETRYQELIDRYINPKKGEDEAARKKLEDEFREMQKTMSDLRSRLPRKFESHGWVWLYLRK